VAASQLAFPPRTSREAPAYVSQHRLASLR